jgi:hypothetical protein
MYANVCASVEDILDMVDDEESDTEEKKKTTQRQAYIKEAEDDITDLMDTSAAKKIIS